MTSELLTFSLKYKTSPPSDPAHVFKSQQCDIDAQFGTTFPNPTHIIRAYPGDQGHWGEKCTTESSGTLSPESWVLGFHRRRKAATRRLADRTRFPSSHLLTKSLLQNTTVPSVPFVSGNSQQVSQEKSPSGNELHSLLPTRAI